MRLWLAWLRLVRSGGCSVCGLPRWTGLGDHTSCLLYAVEELRRSELRRLRDRQQLDDGP